MNYSTLTKAELIELLKEKDNLIAKLENGKQGYAFASGLAAIDAVVKLLKSGDEIIAVDDIYGGAFRLFTHIYQKFGINVKYVDACDANNISEAITAKTQLIWIESPTNPTLKIADIGQKYAKLNELKTMNTNRGSRHFIYLNRTFFGLYNMMHDLRAENVEINRYQKYIKNNA